MAKDRARPFSRKHRKYWIPVTGGMILIGAINVGIGMCAYQRAPEQVQPMELKLPPPSPTAGANVHVVPGEGMIGLGELPAAVMRAFTKEHPQHVPQGAKKLDDGSYEVFYLEDRARQSVRYRADGTPR